MPIKAEDFIARINSGAPDEKPATTEATPGANAATPSADENDTTSSTLGAKLTATTNRSLDKANEILEIPLDPNRAHYPSELRAHTALINTTLTTQIRVDENQMRPPRFDRLPELLKLIAEEEKRLPALPAADMTPAEEVQLQNLLVELRNKRGGDDG
jgi:hypothetical protein